MRTFFKTQFFANSFIYDNKYIKYVVFHAHSPRQYPVKTNPREECLWRMYRQEEMIGHTNCPKRFSKDVPSPAK